MIDGIVGDIGEKLLGGQRDETLDAKVIGAEACAGKVVADEGVWNGGGVGGERGDKLFKLFALEDS